MADSLEQAEDSLVDRDNVGDEVNKAKGRLPCVIPSCTIEHRKMEVSLSYHRFSNRIHYQKIKDAWISIVRKAKGDSCWNPKPQDSICSRHFLSTDFRRNPNCYTQLNPTSLPCRNLMDPADCATEDFEMSGIEDPSFQIDQEDLTNRNEVQLKPTHNYSDIQLQILDRLKALRSLSSPKLSRISESEIPQEDEIQLESIPDPLAFKPEDIPEVPKRIVRCFTCHICDHQVQGSQYSLSRHISARHPEVTKPFMCIDCPSAFEKHMELNHHLVTYHPNDYKPCNLNGKGLYVVHTKNKCPHCNKGFSSPARLDKHIVVHSDEKPYKCDKCGAKFKRTSTLKDHQKSCCEKKMVTLAIRHLKCPQCDKAYVTQRHLNAHLQRKHGIKPKQSKNNKPVLLNCLFCDYKARSSSELTIHNRRHTGEKPVRCQECGAKVPTSLSLARHFRIFCPANKNSTRSLKNDAIPLPLCCQKTPGKCPKPTYKGNGPFSCTGCGKIFNKLPVMRIHLRWRCPAQKKHDFDAVSQGQVLPPLRQALCCQKTPGKCPKPSYTGNGPFICTGCGTRTARRQTMYRHLRVSCPATKQHAQNALHSATSDELNEPIVPSPRVTEPSITNPNRTDPI